MKKPDERQLLLAFEMCLYLSVALGILWAAIRG